MPTSFVLREWRLSADLLKGHVGHAALRAACLALAAEPVSDRWIFCGSEMVREGGGH